MHIPAYRFPHSQRTIVDTIVTDMLEQGVIQESRSPWNSPLFIVFERDGTFGSVINFRRVNAVTLDKHYPSLVLSDLLLPLGRGNSIFSTIDLLSGYWQVELAPASLESTVFSTPSRH